MVTLPVGGPDSPSTDTRHLALGQSENKSSYPPAREAGGPGPRRPPRAISPPPSSAWATCAGRARSAGGAGVAGGADDRAKTADDRDDLGDDRRPQTAGG
jgi:hypothetical protein